MMISLFLFLLLTNPEVRFEFEDSKGNSLDATISLVVCIHRAHWPTQIIVKGESSFTFDFDSDFLIEHAPEWRKEALINEPQLYRLNAVYFLFQVDGYGAELSPGLVWRKYIGSPSVREVSDEFGLRQDDGRSIPIHRGQRHIVKIVFSPEKEQTLLLFDDETGLPVRGMLVEVYRHVCPWVPERLHICQTDDDGLFRFYKDGTPLSFKFTTKGYNIKGERYQDWADYEWTPVFQDGFSKIPLVKRVPKTIHIHIRDKTGPVADQMIIACVVYGRGARCGGVLGKTDKQGNAVLEDFVPEYYEFIYLVDQRGTRIWSMDPVEIVGSNLEIQLPD